MEKPTGDYQSLFLPLKETKGSASVIGSKGHLINICEGYFGFLMIP